MRSTDLSLRGEPSTSGAILWREYKELIHLFGVLAPGVGLLLYWGFGLSIGTSVAIAVFVALALVTTFEVFLRRRQREQNTPIRVERHSTFGDVRVLIDRWEASTSGGPFQGLVEITGSGSSTGPTAAQVRLFARMRDQYPLLLGLAFEALSEELSAVRPPLTQDELRVVTVYLEAGDPPSFSFSFDVPSRSAEMPDGLYADFVDFQVEESGWVH
jgi:hypothetical protein